MTTIGFLRIEQPEPFVRSPGYKIHRAHYRAPKLKRFTDSYSPADWRFLLHLEMNPVVLTYCEQFPSVDEFVSGKRLRHVFSFWAKYRDSQEELISVVSKKSLVPNHAGDMEPKRWSDLCAWAEQHGLRCRFVVAGLAELKNQVLTVNWEQILPYVRSGFERPNLGLSERIHAAVVSREIRVISDLSRVFPKEDPGELLEQVFVLLHGGRVAIDLTREPVQQQSLVGVGHENTVHP